jgi:hypothetical protein
MNARIFFVVLQESRPEGTRLLLHNAEDDVATGRTPFAFVNVDLVEHLDVHGIRLAALNAPTRSLDCPIYV